VIKKITALLCAALSLLAFTITPGSAFAAPGLTSSFVIDQLGTRDIGIDVYTFQSYTNPVGCTNPNVLRLLPSAANYAAISSTIITAFATNRSIRFYVAQCDSDGAALIVSAYVNK
jgi:hypothetical protein